MKMRNTGSRDWKKIGFVKGNGNSSNPHHYSFTDNTLQNQGTCSYRLKQIDNDGTFKYSNTLSVMVNLPNNYFLAQNFPNPFNPTTKIEFGLKNDGYVKLIVYNLLGEKVKELVNGPLNAGYHKVLFDAGSLASGVYIYRLDVKDKFSSVNKMVLIK